MKAFVLGSTRKHLCNLMWWVNLSELLLVVLTYYSSWLHSLQYLFLQRAANTAVMQPIWCTLFDFWTSHSNFINCLSLLCETPWSKLVQLSSEQETQYETMWIGERQWFSTFYLRASTTIIFFILIFCTQSMVCKKTLNLFFKRFYFLKDYLWDNVLF